MSALRAIETLITGIKKAHEVAQRIQNAELNEVVSDLINNSAGLKLEMAELREQNVEFREELSSLRLQQELRSKMVLRDGLYYLSEPVQGYSGGPFCPRCFDYERIAMTMMGPGYQRGRTSGVGVIKTDNGTAWTCPECIRHSE